MNKQVLHGIDTILLRVSNIADAKAWYKEKLGFNTLFEDASQKLVVLDTFGPTSLTIWETAESIQVNPKTTAFPIFKTLDAKEAHAELQKRNIVVSDLTTNGGVTFFTFHDPDNNHLEVCRVHE